ACCLSQSRRPSLPDIALCNGKKSKSHVSIDQSSPRSSATGASHALDLLDPKLPYDIRSRSDAASVNITLQQFVQNGTVTKDTQRKQAMPEAFGEHVDEVRTLAGKIKQHTLDHL